MAIVDVSLDNELKDAFLAIQIDFLAAVNQEDRRAAFQRQFRDLAIQAEFATSNNLISSETASLIRSVIQDIRRLSTKFMERYDASSRISVELGVKCKRILGPVIPPRASEGLKLSKSSKRQQLQDLTAEMTKFRPCRDFFLSHLDAPYPSASDKKRMAQQIGCEVGSVSQWFTNHRRRSNWMTVLKDFAENNKATMQKLVIAVDSPDASTHDVVVPHAAREAILAVRQYFEKITAPTVSEEFMEMVNQPPMTNEELAAYRARRKQIRRVRMEAKRASAAGFAAKQENGVRGRELTGQVPSSIGKRKRGLEDIPPSESERPKKKRGGLAQLKVPILRDPNVRYVVKEDGSVRRLRRKTPLQMVRQNESMAGRLLVQCMSRTVQSSKAIPLDSAHLKINKKRKAIDNDRDASVIEPRLPTTHKRRRFDPTNVISPKPVASSTPSPPSSCTLSEQRSTSAPNVSTALPIEAEWNRMVSAPAQLSSIPQNVEPSVDSLISASQVNAYLASMGIPVAPMQDVYGSSELMPHPGPAFPQQQVTFVPTCTSTSSSPSQFVISPDFLPALAYDTLSQSSSTSWSPSPSESTSPPTMSFIGSISDSTFIGPSPFVSQPLPAAPTPQEALQQMIEAERRAYEAKVQALQAQLALAQAAAQGL